MDTYRKELDVAVKAARRAASIIRSEAPTANRLVIEEKMINDLVTRVDREAQDAIIDVIGSAFADDEILAEEAAPEEPNAIAEGRRWIIDPLDGTTNFVRGLPPYAVSIALQEAAALVVGVVLNVSTNECFTATRGGGAYLDGAAIEVSTTSTPRSSLVTTGIPYRDLRSVDAYLEGLRNVIHAVLGIRRPGSASVDLAYVASGRFDAFFEVGLAPWDVAAGVLLVIEAGGRVTDLVGGDDAVFSQQIVATNGLVHESIRRLVENIGNQGGDG